ncbi:UNVERIFIED_CONTAM: hypothetical protein Sradi_5962400 [Sesamum radiatum]|uniref:Uncharacterized protein n=1 Tax=Sesamum radiatum TaxID=300843 RepID=A0AAW2KGY4_SESRA
MKMKLRDAEEENVMMQSAMDEMRAEVVTSLERVRSFKERMLVSAESDIPQLMFRKRLWLWRICLSASKCWLQSMIRSSKESVLRLQARSMLVSLLF